MDNVHVFSVICIIAVLVCCKFLYLYNNLGCIKIFRAPTVHLILNDGI
jgi:hypothetical protein